MSDSREGTGAEVTFGTTTFAANFQSVNLEGTREFIDTSHLGTTGGRTKKPVSLPDFGGFTLEAHFDSDEEYDLGAAEETVTIKFPIKTPGNSTKAQLSGSAFITRHGVALALEEVITQTLEFQWAAEPTYADEAA